MMFHATNNKTTDDSVVGVVEDATLHTTAKVAGGTARAGLVAADEDSVVTTAVTTNVEVVAAEEVVPGQIDSSVRLLRNGRILMQSWKRICPTPAGF